MDFPHFTRIERETADGGSRHVVVHSQDPQLAIEMVPDTTAPDQVGQGVIRRVSVPNSWAGQYSQYSKLIAQAQAFFRASFAEPMPKIPGRLGR
jgi:maltose-binding protein MalE